VPSPHDRDIPWHNGAAIERPDEISVILLPRRSSVWIGICAVAAALALTAHVAARQSDLRTRPFVFDSLDDGQKRVLVIHQLRPDSPLSAGMEDVYRTTFRRELGTRLDYYSEFMDTLRFAQPDYEAAFATYLRARYAGYHFDVIIATTTATLNLVRHTLDDVFGNTPVVFGAGKGVARPPHATGVASTVDLDDTLELALRLQPDTRNVFVVSGNATDIDRAYGGLAHQQLQRFSGHLTLTNLDGLPMADLEQRVAHLPPDSLIYYVLVSRDGAGRQWLPVDALDRVTAAANAPVYAWHEVAFGHGIVGGQLFDSNVIARETTALALRVLRGESVDDIPVREITPYVAQFDWRQMERWHLDASRLPAGATILFRPQTRWERVRPYTMLGLALLSVVGAFASALWLERRRRHRAEARTRRYLTTVAQLDRRAVMGRLTASLAHELRQPLSAILLNSQAARIMLESDMPRVTDLLEIVEDIRKDDERAAGIIARVRTMLGQHGSDEGPVDIVDLTRETVSLVANDAGARGIDVRLDAPDAPLFTIGDRIHLQQALLNLLLNALDAMADTPPDDRRLSVVVAPAGATIDVAVRDRGTGFTLDETRLFEPFFTTKPDGMGMGLFIARGIVDAHGGRISAVSHAPHGSTFRIQLPRQPAGAETRMTGDRRVPV
jgi:signal transduction histidine kinase